MLESNNFACFMIGEGAILRQCAEYLVAEGHHIHGICSRDESVAHWAEDNRIDCVKHLDDFRIAMEQVDFDFLFSVVNNTPLPKDILALPRKLAINYHDSLLPRYAGTNATTWAILHCEKVHGVSWHVMDDSIDTGDIIEQRHIDIDDDETSLSLNGKCYAAAINSFRSLVRKLCEGNVIRMPQNLEERTYFSRNKRPINGCIISWCNSAHEIETLCRSLEYGVYPKPLGTAKCAIHNDLFLVPRVTIGAPSQCEPGTIVAVQPEGLVVSTGTNDVILSELLTLDGRAVPIASVVEQYSLFSGYRLCEPTAQDLDYIHTTNLAISKQEMFWVDKLGQLKPAILPGVSQGQTFDGQGRYEIVPVGLSDGLASLVARTDSEWGADMSVVAAFAGFMSRINREEAIDIGFTRGDTLHHRGLADAFFSSQVPLRASSLSSVTVRGHLASFQRQMSEIEERGTFTLDIGVRRPHLQNVMQTDGHTLFPVSVCCVETAEQSQLPLGTHLAMLITQDKRYSWAYDADAFDSTFIECMLSSFLSFMTELLTNSSSTICGIPLLSESEHRQIVVGFNDTGTDFEQDACIHDLIAAQMAKTPDAISLVCDDDRVSYEELNERSSRMAYHLQRCGVGPDVPVGVYMERSVEMVVAILGVLRAGGCYVPLDPGYPMDRISFIIEDAQLPLLLTQERFVKRFSDDNVSFVCVDSEWETIAGGGQGELIDVSGPDNIAHIIYTSGSTGEPKGVMSLHRGLVNRLQWMQEMFRIDASDAVLQKTPFTFDVSVWEFLWPLMIGARLVMARPEGHKDSTYLANLIVEERITTIHFVPSMLRVFLEDEGVEQCGCLKRVICSGEELTPNILARYYESLDAHLYNLYGPTEASIDVSYWACSPEDDIVPIGKPIANTQLYVLDENLQPLPIGVPGELHIGGVGLARGYLNRPSLTAEKFIPDPFREETGSRLYKTGDLACHLPSGDIEFLGRIDNQVKIRGFRIETGEVEAALRQHAAVRDAIVNPYEDSPGDKSLVAYLLTEENQILKTQDLRAFLNSRLPEYMLPSAFMFLDEFPLSRNGKIDRKSLPAPESSRSQLSKAYVAPRTTEEEKLAAIWAETLRIERVGIDDNFFELGGDSIKSLQVIAKSRGESLSLGLSIEKFFKYPTVRELIKRVRDKGGGLPLPKTKAFDLITEKDRRRLQLGITDAYPMAMLQKGMVFHCELNPESHFYQVVMTYHVAGPLEVELLRRALDDVIARHPTLRTSYDLSNYSVPMQLVHCDVTPQCEIHDLTGTPDRDQQQAIDRWVEKESRIGFRWDRAPLFRVGIHKRTENTFQFSMSYPDAILDGWSASSATVELFERYVGYILGRPLPVCSSPRVTYRDFVAMELSTLRSTEIREVWDAEAKDCECSYVNPRTYPRATQDAAISDDFEVLVPSDTYAGLKATARLAGVPIKHVLLAAHMRLLSILSRRRKVATGMVANGRLELPDGDKCLGNHLNTILFSLVLPNGTWIDLVRDIFRAEQRLLPYRRFPNSELQLGRHEDPLFDVVFNFTHFHAFGTYTGSDTCRFLEGKSTDPFHYTLAVTFRIDEWNVHRAAVLKENAQDQQLQNEAEEARSDLIAVLNYNDSMISFDGIRQIGNLYLKILGKIAEEPLATYQESSLLSESEHRQIVVGFNDTGTDFEQDACIHDLIAAQMAKTPDAISLVCDDDRVSYEELNERSSRMAYHLQRCGVGPDVPVGVYMERSVEMVVAILGVLRAGGCYVPLDPGYPMDRISFIIEDAQLPLLLTQERFVKRFSDDNVSFVCVDSEWETIAGGGQGELIDVSGPDNIAHIIYTSGSTGEPKGVMSLHRGLVNRLQWMQEMFRIDASDAVLQKTPFTFDVSVWEFLWPLMIGARLVMARPEGHKDSTYLANLIVEERITTIHFVPSMLRVFLEDEGVEQCGCLKRVICSGEELTPNILARYYESLDAHLYNLYGPTEASIDVSYWACSPEDDIVPIGKPIANTQLYVLDENLQPLPIGVPGELHIGGVGLARGYLNRPSLTAEKFIPDPFREETGSRLYKTGDLACHLPSGDIEFLGRIDNQVKIRGFRIETGEVEAALRQHAAVRDAIVNPYEDSPGDKSLVAYLLTEENQILKTQDLRAFLNSRLPEYMLPSAFMFLDEFPLSRNGKIDRKSLPAPESSRSQLSKAYVAPRTTEEEKLAAIWAETLRIERVGIDDNFFELGGDSILGLQICFKAQQQAMHIRIKQIFECPTIGELASVCIYQPSHSEDVRVEGYAPLTPSQHCFFESEFEEPDHWNASFVVEIRHRIQADILRQAFIKLYEHHDALRLRYARNGKGWVQYYSEDEDVAGIPLIVQDLCGMGEVDAGRAIRDRVEDMHTAMDLERGPLALALYCESDREWESKLVVVFHHLIIDGISWRIIIDDIEKLYQQISQDEVIELPPKTCSYGEWSQSLSVLASSSRMDEQIEYWRSLPWEKVSSLPVDDENAERLEGGARSMLMSLSKEETTSLLLNVPAAFGAKMIDVLLTSLSFTLQKWTKSRAVNVDIETHGRHETIEDLDVSRTVGWFSTRFPVILGIASDAEMIELLLSVKQQLSQTLEFGEKYGICRYLSERGKVVDVMKNLPRAEVSLNYLGQFDQVLPVSSQFRLSNEVLGPRRSPKAQSPYLLEIECMVVDQRLQTRWKYCEGALEELTIKMLMEGYSKALREIADRSQSTGRLRLLR